MQGVCRYPDRCQGYTCTLQVSRQVSGVYRYPAGIQTGVRSRRSKIRLRSLQLSAFQDASLGEFLLALTCFIEEVTLWEVLHCLTDEGRSFARTAN